MLPKARASTGTVPNSLFRVSRNPRARLPIFHSVPLLGSSLRSPPVHPSHCLSSLVQKHLPKTGTTLYGWQSGRTTLQDSFDCLFVPYSFWKPRALNPPPSPHPPLSNDYQTPRQQLIGRTVDVEATRRLEAEMDAAADSGSAGSPARAGGAGAGAGKGKPPQSPVRANGQRGGKGGDGGGGASTAPIAGGGEGGGANGDGEVSKQERERWQTDRQTDGDRCLTDMAHVERESGPGNDAEFLLADHPRRFVSQSNGTNTSGVCYSCVRAGRRGCADPARTAAHAEKSTAPHTLCPVFDHVAAFFLVLPLLFLVLAANRTSLRVAETGRYIDGTWTA